ncbi:hypothetical protein DRQ12_10995 [candidate division KSB1 bacterium]|nr:MAG: hypothetical protein DRQ12_10995 [candidate division KSB1 bacterium]RKY87975.1 MAG: hypothetical protein DRQ11_04875 [candidate division KSB1 bacterium]
MQQRSNILSNVLIFLMGLLLGGFGAVTVVREAVPLRDHFYAIVIYSLFTIPVLLILLVWYMRVVKTCKAILGEKGGKLISSIMSFLLIATIVLFILIVGIFFTAIA